VFQRSAPYVMPKPDRAYTALHTRAFEALPRTQRFGRGLTRFVSERFNESLIEGGGWVTRTQVQVWKAFLRRQVPDAALRAKLRPDYRIGCKRVLPSSSYFPTMQRDDVTLVTDAIVRVVPGGVETADGTVHDLDVLICATGFDATGWLKGIDVVGREERPLAEAWAGGARAHLGITVSGFPNLFLLYGPNTNQPGNSLIFILEAQAAYAVRGIKAMTRAGATSLDVKPEVQEGWIAEIDAAMAGTVWQSGCASYFHDEHGRVATQLPHPSRWYWKRTLQFLPEDFDLR